MQLPAGDWVTVLDCLCERFPGITREQWRDRMARGRVTDGEGRALDMEHPYRNGLVVRYFREVVDERPIPFEEVVLHVDDDLLVADKPHFLPVAPVGGHVEHTLLARLVRALRQPGPGAAAPHRSRHGRTGAVLDASANPRAVPRPVPQAQDRQALSRHRAGAAGLAVSAACATRVWSAASRSSACRKSRACRTRKHGSMCCSASGALWRYALQPVTGRKHQLRVHMAALGAGDRRR